MSHFNEIFTLTSNNNSLTTTSFEGALAYFDSGLKDINDKISKTSATLENEIAKKLEKVKPIIDTLLDNNLNFQHIKIKNHSSEHGIVLAVTKCGQYSIVFDGASLKKILRSSDTVENDNIQVTSFKDDKLIKDLLERLDYIYKNLMSDILDTELKFQSALYKVLETV